MFYDLYYSWQAQFAMDSAYSNAYYLLSGIVGATFVYVVVKRVRG